MRLVKFAGLGFLVFSIYYLIIMILQTQPVADFEVYYKVALELASGHKLSESYKYFQSPGYPYLLSSMFYLVGSHSILLPQIFNALALALLVTLLMVLDVGESHSFKWVGFFIMVLNLNFLSMVSVLCSEIFYGLFFMGGLFLIGLGFEKIQNDLQRKRIAVNSILFLSGIALGISQTIRPTTTPFILLLNMIFLIGLSYFNAKNVRQTFREKIVITLRLFLPAWIGFFIVALPLYYLSSYGFTFQPLQNGLWNTYIGFNVESRGWWNPNDPKLFEKFENDYHWEAKKVNRYLRPFVLERVRKNWFKNLQILPEKLWMLMDPKGLLWWSVDHSSTPYKDRIYQISVYLRLINVLILIVSIWAWVIWLSKRSISREGFFAFCIVGTVFSNIILHGYFLEVQPRYINHLWMVLIWCFPLSLWSLWNSISKKLLWGR